MRYIFVMIIALFLSGTPGTTNAQVGFHINLNLGSQPAWGPTGYDYVENYYMPDIEVYYNVPQHRYYYMERGRWISSANMPARYHDYDIYNSYKVVVNDRNPWRNHISYRDRYVSYRGRHDQEVIRNSHEERYLANKNHPGHANWVREQKHHDNGNHNGMKNGNDNHGNGNNNHGNKNENKGNDHKDNGNGHGNKGKK